MDTVPKKKVSDAARTLGKLGGQKGGKARAEALTPGERQAIGSHAIAVRWARKREQDAQENVPRATHGSPDTPLKIDNVEIECYVLADGTRVLSQAGFQAAMGKHRKANVRREEGEEQLPAILQGKSINPFIDEDLIEKSKPIRFHTPNGVLANGYRAEILPNVCEVYLKARDAGVLNMQLHHVARQAEILIRGFAHVGIIALVDEATGYQEVRDREELHKILAAYISPELLHYAKRFPPEFYKQICRLHGWTFNPFNPAGGPRLIGKITNHLVYDRLPEGVLEGLRKKNPVIRKGRRKHKHYQFLTEDIGDPHLEKQVASVTTLMRASPNKKVFDILFANAFPIQNTQIEMVLDQEGELWSAIEESTE